MWNCPVCGKENPTMVCGACQFDGSCDYERYPTVTGYPTGKAAISQIQEENTATLRCPNCGSEAFSLMVAKKKLKCLQCGTLCDPEMAEVSADDKDNVNVVETSVEKEIKKTEFRWLKWSPAILAAAIVLGAIVYVICQNNTGWVSMNGDEYYFVDGQKQTGWQNIDGNYYLFDDFGHKQTGWQNLETSWFTSTYYFDEDGVMLTGWQLIDGKTYYFTSMGRMLTGEQIIDGNRYLFAQDGALIK